MAEERLRCTIIFDPRNGGTLEFVNYALPHDDFITPGREVVGTFDGSSLGGDKKAAIAEAILELQYPTNPIMVEGTKALIELIANAAYKYGRTGRVDQKII